MTTNNTCSACHHWQLEKTDPRMVQLGFASCAKSPITGMTVRGCAKYFCFTAMTPERAAARASQEGGKTSRAEYTPHNMTVTQEPKP